MIAKKKTDCPLCGLSRVRTRDGHGVYCCGSIVRIKGRSPIFRGALCEARTELQKAEKENRAFRDLLQKALVENGLSVADIFRAVNSSQEVS